MKKTLPALLLILGAASVAIFFLGEIQADPKRFAAAALPTCNDSPSRNGRIYTLLDPVDEADCSVGGGSDPPHVCLCIGATSTYVAIPGPPVAFPATRITRDADQVIPDSTPTFISWDNETKDDDDWWSLAPNPTRMTFDATGEAFCSLSITVAEPTPSGKLIRLTLFINGVQAGNSAYVSTADGAGSSASFADLLPIIADRYIEVEIFQNTGSAVDLLANLSCFRVQ